MPFKSGANVLFAQEGVPYFAIFPLKVKRAPEECNLGTGFSEERLAKPLPECGWVQNYFWGRRVTHVAP